MKKIQYRLLVATLRLAAWLAKSHGCAQGILMDAEGDSGYYKVRRPKPVTKPHPEWMR